VLTASEQDMPTDFHESRLLFLTGLDLALGQSAQSNLVLSLQTKSFIKIYFRIFYNKSYAYFKILYLYL